jgi:hypothetical protein
MQTDTLGGTVAAVIDLGRDARRVAAALQRHQSGIGDPHERAILHRLYMVASDFALAISTAAAALPSAHNAITIELAQPAEVNASDANRSRKRNGIK